MDSVEPEAGKTIDLQTILRMIPHRPPFLFIDRVEGLVAPKRARGVKNVTTNEPFFAGHFPGQPIMPGVLIVEAMAQTSAVLVVEAENLIDAGRIVYFMTVDRTRFRAPVVPGDVLYLDVELIRNKANVWKFSGKGYVNDKLCAEAEFSAMIVDPNA